ncbi:type II and III secretion system protein family protein [Thalassotalea ponticola]|uniref:type II and III secretion system protein family protein n=1 Tax=Thalassotalea ponticola TaxID=1523392 RepID=UPI0025B4AB4F|nr:type II and III secretion system protein family protein [Thalassotalea ponticola]MDN3651731.1 type II and III secretion system protein family protein [Thalassotalea ponticola]
MNIKLIVVPFIMLTLSVFLAEQAYAGGPFKKDGDVVTVPIFKSDSLRVKGDIQRISIGNPNVADILILRSDELYILGKALGTTNVMLWDENDKLIDVINLQVTHDLNSLRKKFHYYLPSEEIGVESSQGQLVLSGQSSSLAKMDQAVELARAYAESAKSIGGKKSEVLNMLSVGGGHQVMLEVTVAEVQSEIARKLDSKMLLTFDGSDGYGGVISGGDFWDALNVGPALSKGFFGTYLDGDMLFQFAFDVAKQHGLAKILAEPNITALSGQKAEFLSGGEFPIPVPGGSNNGTTIQYRDFGVGVSFVPTVLDSGKINLNLNVLVSELSTAAAVQLVPDGTSSRFNIPSIVKRSTSTTVELGDGQTIAIGGLISDTLRETVDKIPGLGDIPILGQLFKSQQFQKSQTELVIMVTPRLVRPFNKKRVVLPTDGFVPANDLEFYLLGKMTDKKQPESLDVAPNEMEYSSNDVLPDNGGTQSSYGHEIQTEEGK